MSEEKNPARSPEATGRKIGVMSDQQPDLVKPGAANERDHGAVDGRPMAGGTLNLDDDDLTHPRGNVTGNGRTANEQKPSDAGDLGTPDAGLSDRNGPSDRATRRNG
jgi:hypothetical protein